jgi:TraY domain
LAMACYNITMTNKPRKRAPGGGRKPKGPIGGNVSWFQARISEDLRAALEQAAAQNGRSLSQEAQVRLKASFDLPQELQRKWGPPEVKTLGYLIARVTRSIQNTVATDPTDVGEMAWHRNSFTHAAVRSAIAILLERFRPSGAIEVPPQVLENAKILERAGCTPEQVEAATTPAGVGQASALGLLSQLAGHVEPPALDSKDHHATGHYVFPDIHNILGEPNK